MSPAFLTGSRVYGTPTKDSDVDLVCLVDAETLVRLVALGERGGSRSFWQRLRGWFQDSVNPYEAVETSESIPVRFGNLNLILCTTQKRYDEWWRARTLCSCETPVGRERAVEIHQSVLSLPMGEGESS